jgi:hypothetical protein
MLRLDRRVIDRFLDEAPAREAVYGIDQYLAPRDRDDPEFGLTRPELNLRLFLIYVGEVGNGGHAKFFLNPSGGYAERTLVAMREMGLDALAGVLEEAGSVFAGGLIPTSQDEREVIIHAMPSEVMSFWGQLDKQVWRREASTDVRVLQYLQDNRNQLLRPETA